MDEKLVATNLSTYEHVMTRARLMDHTRSAVIYEYLKTLARFRTPADRGGWGALSAAQVCHMRSI